MRVGRPIDGRHQRGMTYIALLTLIAVMLIGQSVVGPLWARDAQREQEQGLLRIGLIYAEAIDAYYRVNFNGVREYPPSLEALLQDNRTNSPVRHLRRAYSDPMNPGKPFDLIRSSDGTIRGVASSSEASPLTQVPVALGRVQLAAARSYRDWKFVMDVSP